LQNVVYRVNHERQEVVDHTKDKCTFSKGSFRKSNRATVARVLIRKLTHIGSMNNIISILELLEFSLLRI
jgi:hypothetical protein